MKKTLALAGVASLAFCVVSNDAGADTRTAVPKTALRATRIVGTFTVPAVQTGELAAFSCANISISATSKDTIPPAPGDLFATPKWSRSVMATGTYSSGSCSYSLIVPAGSAFYLNAGGVGDFACHYVSTWVGPTGAAIGPLTVPLGTAKTQNFAITKVLCEFIN